MSSPKKSQFLLLNRVTQIFMIKEIDALGFAGVHLPAASIHSLNKGKSNG
jgi:hypothetical protein